MNQTLEKAVLLVRSFPEAEQEDFAQEILRLAEERQIDAKLAEAEASGEPIPHDEFWRQVRARIAAES